MREKTSWYFQKYEWTFRRCFWKIFYVINIWIRRINIFHIKNDEYSKQIWQRMNEKINLVFINLLKILMIERYLKVIWKLFESCQKVQGE